MILFDCRVRGEGVCPPVMSLEDAESLIKTQGNLD